MPSTTADKLAHLAVRGVTALGDRLDPEIRRGAGRAIMNYGKVNEKFHALHDNVGKIQNAIRDVGFEL